MTTWGDLHVGDVVRGKDQRPWEVVGIASGQNWIVAGEYGEFHLEQVGNDERSVTTSQRLIEPVELIERADHSAAATAVQTMLDGGLGPVEIVREGRMELSQPAPRKEEKRDRWGRYLLPHPEAGKEQAWTRVSTVARTLADEYGLSQWDKRMVAKGLAMRPDLIAGAAAAHPETDKSTLDSIAKQAKEFAGSSTGANFGTAFHSFAQRLDSGEPLDSLHAQPPLDADLKAYTELMASQKLGVVRMEEIVVLPGLSVAGKFDRIVTQPSGKAKAAERSILDLKSGKDLSHSWLEIAVQQALYSRATLIWNPVTGTYEPMPEVDQNRGLILHTPIGRAHPQLYAVDLIKGWKWAQLAMAVRAARTEAKRGVAWLVEPISADLLVHRVQKARSREELSRLWDQHHPKGEWTEEVNAAAATAWEDIQRYAMAGVPD